MARKDETFHEFVMNDVLGGLRNITSRSMFGGWGIYKNGDIFAIIADGELYFKVDDSTRAEYEARGSHPFVYSMKGKKETTMSYWTLPEEVMENPEEVGDWVEEAVRVSKKAKAKKKPK